jgi:DNA-binding CsgD family transcriptional regulator
MSAALERLTRRERQMLDALVQGKTDKEIASALGISPKTVSFHLCNLYRKLGVPNRRAAREKFATKPKNTPIHAKPGSLSS